VFFSGTEVYARWKDKHFYPGHVLSADKAGKYKMQFEDGDILSVKVTDMMTCSLLPAGQSVLAVRQEWGELATVTGHCHLDNKPAYVVTFTEDNQQKR
jgi:hypothetical protein